ncbi:NAD(P)-dependent alcohol dehydrogenase [Streptomyces phaeoluteigriseus]|uniref:NAD(P)-dependent alcohol dehydrogenase n=1 Tax=Streptomyces phaeoluteigriseus TaxID=114686 RepID=A0ABY4ZBM9_9ACTN|nr:NAD(P)-dependent alcohol dehydrogenase [Streptomyces phaeoluteigriseus]USQ86350.1 NAD(P)-dependent alcohol dehydrogenase [Streptomyces phaeoluteigriseus]
MKAIVQDVYGPAEVLELRDVDKPVAGDDDVLLRVRAAGVDPSVWHLMTGLPYPIRIMGFGLRRPKLRVRGWDVAGTVESVGRNVTRFRPGDEVFGTCEGSFAEYACAREDRLAAKPPNAGFEQVAAVPISAFTALYSLREQGRVQPGQKVLVIGAGGGVGTYAVQLAKVFEAQVTGVCGTDKVELVRSLGADHVIDYTRDDFTADGRRYDLILDTAGNRPLSHLRRALTPRGTLVIVGGEGGGRWLGGLHRALGAMALSPFVRQNLRAPFVKEPTRDVLEPLARYIAAGQVTPVVDRTYPLAEAADAIRHWGKGHTRGKLVLTV